MRSIFIAAILIVLGGCSPSSLIEKGLTPQERGVIRGAIDDITRGDGASLAKKMPPELASRIQPAMPRMREALPSPPLQISLTGANGTGGQGKRELEAVYEVHGKTGWALVQASTETSAGNTLLTSIYVQRTAGDPMKLNGFSLADAGVAKYAMLAAMIAAVAVTITALLRIWRSDAFERRWLWTIGTLVGVMSLKLNWTTGQFFFQPISFQIFSAGAVKSPVYAPWVMSLALPLVAIIALFRKGKARVEAAGEEAREIPPSEAS